MRDSIKAPKVIHQSSAETDLFFLTDRVPSLRTAIEPHLFVKNCLNNDRAYRPKDSPQAHVLEACGLEK